MSGRDTRQSLERLLLEYIAVIREQTRNQTNLIRNFIESNERATLDVNRLLQRYLASIITDRNNNTNHGFSFSNINNTTDFPPLNSTNQQSFGPILAPQGPRPRSFAQSPLRYPGNTRTRRNTRPRPVSYVTPTRMSSRNNNRITRNRRRNLLNQILESTLYTPTTRRPATASDISRNISYHNWRDISNSTDQTLGPITQEEFTDDIRVGRINHCGHLFMADALNTYLTEFDHRCPICRYNISSQIFPPSTYAEAAASPPLIPSNNTPFTFDLSLNPSVFSFNNDSSGNFNTFLPRNLTRQSSFDLSLNIPRDVSFNFDLGNEFNNAVTQLSNAMLSQMATAISNPDNSGNFISAEYSLFVPAPVSTYDNSTNTSDTDEPPELIEDIDDDETY